ncbi:MAG: hypothetical protein ABW252_02305 [Polyangiales bacterium]
MSRALTSLLAPLLALVACLPDNPCDPGDYHDHGACYPRSSMQDAGPLLDAAMPVDAGGGDPTATFGKACTSDAECGGVAPTCAVPQLPYCTALNCLDRPGICPSRWTCLDARGISPVAGVDSLCLRP